jgi:mono/diheme cytochrome c family protein
MTIRLRTLAIVVLIALALAGGAGALVTWLGVYDVSATRQHTAPVFELLDFAMRRSVEARARSIAVPRDLDERAKVVAGAATYRAYCVQCHGAPGVAPDPFAFGLAPAPANLLAAGRTWQPAEIFWIVRHGIKMSGMPAWQYRLSDADIWDVVAFVRAMPAMAPRDYEELARSLPRQAPAPSDPHAAAALRPGSADAGRQATRRYLCATCHTIPGFVSARHHVGPPLEGIGTRAFIAGVIANTRQNMVRFLRNPRDIDPLSAMPAMGMTEQDAHDIAAFLATLDDVGVK